MGLLRPGHTLSEGASAPFCTGEVPGARSTRDGDIGNVGSTAVLHRFYAVLQGFRLTRVLISFARFDKLDNL